MVDQLTIENLQDLGKLEGWTIKKATGQGSTIILILKHGAAERPVKLVLQAQVVVGMNGNMTTHSARLLMQTSDVEEK